MMTLRRNRRQNGEARSQTPAPSIPPTPSLTRGSAPWARTRGRRCPRGPRMRRRGRAAARSCARSWPLRTHTPTDRPTDRGRSGRRSAHGRARQPIPGRSAPRRRHWRLPVAETRGRAYAGRPPGGAKRSRPPSPPLPPPPRLGPAPPPAAAAPAGAPALPSPRSGKDAPSQTPAAP